MEVKMCPFCGGKAIVSDQISSFTVICLNQECLARGPIIPAKIRQKGDIQRKKDLAVSAWNNR